MKKEHPEALKESPKVSESQFLKFTWVAVVLLAIILAGVGLAYMTCRKGTQEPFREPAAGFEQQLACLRPSRPFIISIHASA